MAVTSAAKFAAMTEMVMSLADEVGQLRRCSVFEHLFYAPIADQNRRRTKAATSWQGFASSASFSAMYSTRLVPRYRPEQSQ